MSPERRTDGPLTPPAFEDVRAAAARIEGFAQVTPLVDSQELGERLGGRLLIKAEVLQRTGSFKIRGAFNKISQLDEAHRAAGVVAYSSGNHAQAVACAARACGAAAAIVMPYDAPEIKIERTRAQGAEIVLRERAEDARVAVAESLAAERGATLVRPYDDPDVIAGQGTVGLEIISQAAALGADIDTLVVPCGGGGLTAGCALAMAQESPQTAIYTAEPEGFDDTARSLAAGTRARNEPDARSFCDALLAPAPGSLTFEVNGPRVTGGLVVSDDEVAMAMATAFDTLKLVLEPGGAAALAAVLSGRIDCRGKTVAVIASGGNVDPAVFAKAVTGDRAPRH